MKHTAICAAVLGLQLIINVTVATAQGTAFTYQGQLNNNGAPANGSFDVAFTLYTTNVTGAIYAGPVTNTAVAVTNGLFTTTVDFGNIFYGASNWLQIAVSPGGANTFSTLSPRQQLTPVPAALFANTASNILGTIPAGQISGAIPLAQLPASVITNNATDATLAGNFFGNFGGYFFGSGSGLTGLNPAYISPGTAGINITGSAATAGTATNATIAQVALTASVAATAITATTATYANTFTNPVVDGQLSPNIPRLNGTNWFTGTNTLSNVLIATNPANQLSGTFTGNGSALTSLNPTSLAAGTAGISITGNAATATTAAAAALATSFTNPVADAQLSANIPRLNGTNVFTGTNTFSNVLIATNPANQLSGTFTGNGLGLTNVPGTLIQSVVAGASVAAQPNTAYDLTAPAQATVTLPTSANVGDIVQVDGTGSGGWQALLPPVWTESTSSGTTSQDWSSVASDASGSHLVAALYGGIWTSTNSGVTWTASSGPLFDNSLTYVASSASGSNLVAVIPEDGIWISTNSGVTWTESTSSGTIGQYWYSVASSASGSNLVAVALYGGIWTSTNSGVTWMESTSSGTIGQYWYSVASSASGSNLVAVTDGGGIWTSTNSGVTWTESTSSGTIGQNWDSVASSASGSNLVAVTLYGGIWTSTNSGVTWMESTSSGTIGQNWQSVASSASGSNLVAVVYDGGIWTSTNSGTTWTESTSSGTIDQTWISVASSASGGNLVAVVIDGGIWTFMPQTVTGLAGSSQEFQYLGNGVWQPLTPSLGDNGAALTNLNLSQVSGTLSSAQLPAGVVTNTEVGVTLSGTFIGTFSGLGISPTNFGGDLTVTPTPAFVGATGGNNGYAILQGSGLAGIAAGLAGFLVYNVSVPANPTLVAQVNQGVFNLGAGSGNNGQLFFVSGTNGIADYSFMNTASPSLVWQTNVPGSFMGGAVAGNGYLYVAATPNLLIYIDTNASAPVLVGQITGFTSVPTLALNSSSSTLYIGGQNSLQAYSLTNPAVPALQGSIAAPPSMSLTLNGTQAFLACSNAGFRIFDVTSPTNILPLAVVSNTGPSVSTMRVAVAGNRGYAANYNEGLHVYDLTVITNPVSLSVYTNTLYPHDVTLNGPYAYVACDVQGLLIYGVGDVADFSAGSSSNAISGQYVGVTISGGGSETYVFSGNMGQSQSIGGPNQAFADFDTIGGGVNNNIQIGSLAATIAGGVMGHIGTNSLAAFIGGGFSSSVGDNSQNTVIGGGDTSTIGTNSSDASILGGGKNIIGNNAFGSTIGGGVQNVISNNANYATIPGGNQNTAGASYAFAAGNNAKANNQGSFVWADSQSSSFASTANDQVSFRAQGGVLFTSGGNSVNTAVSWSPGNASWSFTSDRNTKDRVVPVDPQSILEKVAHIPINEWSYIGYGQRHIGPMAQDFHAQFPLSENDKTLNDADLHGVALAAIQGLNQKLEQQEAENAELKARLDKLEQLLNAKAGETK